MSAGEWMYRLLLRAYPPEFRAVYEREMVLVFRDQRREMGGTGLRFWTAMLWDVARSAPALRLDAWRARWGRDIPPEEGTMTTMAILAVLVGAIEVATALTEALAANIASTNGYWLAGVILTVTVGALLCIAGIAMLRRTAGAAAWARGAAVGCLAVVVLIRLVQPWMSIFAMLLGIVFPIALLIFLHWTGGRGSPAHTPAVQS